MLCYYATNIFETDDNNIASEVCISDFSTAALYSFLFVLFRLIQPPQLTIHFKDCATLSGKLVRRYTMNMDYEKKTLFY